MPSVQGPISTPSAAPTRILVGIASFGTKNDHYLRQVIRQYRGMTFQTDIVVFSNAEKTLPPGVELRVGLPSRDPWSLPFAHQQVFADRAGDYDLFIYSEDDILITEQNLRAFELVAEFLHDGEIAGFVRTERDAEDNTTYPDIHGHFRWDPSSAVVRGDYLFAHLSCEHSACYVMSRSQLRRAIASGGYLVKPHDWEYDLLCTAATDPYTQCGLRKLIPISHLSQFSVEHLSNRYAGQLGMAADELKRQIEALRGIAADPVQARGGIVTETRLRRRASSKRLYDSEPSPQLVSAVGAGTGALLSFGCGNGALEAHLTGAGWDVLAIPVDPVVAVSAAARGVALLSHDIPSALRDLGPRTFDRIVADGVVHLTPDPVGLLSLLSKRLAPGGVLIMSLPNMWHHHNLVSTFWFGWRQGGRWTHARMGSHFASARAGQRWCARAGLRADRVSFRPPPGPARPGPLLRRVLTRLIASDVIVAARVA